MSLIENKTGLEILALAINGEPRYDSSGNVDIFGKASLGTRIALKIQSVTPAVDLCEVRITNSIGQTSSALLINGDITTTPEGKVEIIDVKGERFVVGSELTATILRPTLVA